MRALWLLALVACAEPYAPVYVDDAGVSAAPAMLLGEEDGGTSETWPAGATVYGESRWQTDPSILMTWEENPIEPAQRVLHIGRGQSGLGWKSVQDLRLDADSLLAFMTNGRLRMKLQDHPTAGQLLHLTEVPKLWFGNTCRAPAELHYQGTNSAAAGSDTAQPMSIMGQSMEAKAGATQAVGGDLSVRAGGASAQAGVVVPLDPGELILGGGKVEGATRGNIALHDPPVSWEGMEGGVFVRDVATAPTGTPTSGGYLYASGGALYWVGSSGTVTQVAAP